MEFYSLQDYYDPQSAELSENTLILQEGNEKLLPFQLVRSLYQYLITVSSTYPRTYKFPIRRKIDFFEHSHTISWSRRIAYEDQLSDESYLTDKLVYVKRKTKRTLRNVQKKSWIRLNMRETSHSWNQFNLSNYSLAVYRISHILIFTTWESSPISSSSIFSLIHPLW